MRQSVRFVKTPRVWEFAIHFTTRAVVAMLEMRMLGQFDVRRDGRAIEIPSRPAQSLLAYLVLNPDTPHRREKLAGLLWPDAAEANARSNLRAALWRIRKSLEGGPSAEPGYLLVDDIALAFDARSDYWLDAAVLARKLEEGASAADLVEAVSVYRGELLPGFYDEWVVLERERLQALFEHKMKRLLDRLVAEQRWSEALELGERWIALGHTPEPAYRALMAAHAGLGDLSSVAAAFQRCAEALWRELGVEPSEETRAQYEGLTRAERSSHASVSAARPSAATSAVRLPVPATPFVGREQELVEVGRILDDPDCRMLTLVGPGGLVGGRFGSALSRRDRNQQRHDLATVGDLNLFFFFTHAAQHLSGLLFELPDPDRFHKSSNVSTFVGTF
jgi:DNA-binding SARP family transcriptional activator